MTCEQKEIVAALNNVTYLPGSYDKRFAQNMSGLASLNDGRELTDKQNIQLYRQLKRYRRQIKKTYLKYESKIKELMPEIEKRKEVKKPQKNTENGLKALKMWQEIITGGY